MERSAKKMTSCVFDTLWRNVVERSKCFPVVQEYNELQYIYNLIAGCESYLEVGTAEGNSLSILARVLAKNARITYVDFDETHTRPYREQVVSELTKEGCYITPVHGNSHDPAVIMKANGRYDVVFIDAGHSYDDALQDARNYGKMATKYIIFHDINLPEVKAAFTKYKDETGLHGYTISNSETFGYGVLEIK
jgi:predicted O-methyltransferase YrrM